MPHVEYASAVHQQSEFSLPGTGLVVPVFQKEVHNQDNVTTNLIDQDMQATSTSEQSTILNQSEIRITSDSNIISYS
nr:hypothetical protein [Tanacetum cinerariifolium]